MNLLSASVNGNITTWLSAEGLGPCCLGTQKGRSVENFNVTRVCSRRKERAGMGFHFRSDNRSLG